MQVEIQTIGALNAAALHGYYEYDVASPSVTVTDGSPLSLNVQF